MFYSKTVSVNEMAKKEIANIRSRLNDLRTKARCKTERCDHKTLSVHYKEMQKRLNWLETNYFAIQHNNIRYCPVYLPRSLPFWVIIDGEDEAVMMGAYLTPKEANDFCLSLNKILCEKTIVISNKEKIRMESEGKAFIFSE